MTIYFDVSAVIVNSCQHSKQTKQQLETEMGSALHLKQQSATVYTSLPLMLIHCK
jgi:hypothetical protein